MRAADFIVDVGPGAGVHGGEIIAAGTIDDIIAAAKNDDNLSIELIEEAGEKVGKAIAFLINTFNPETVIVGGNLAAAGDYIMLPLKSATNKYSLNLVYKDTKFRVSKMTENANAWGVAMLIRNKIIGL